MVSKKELIRALKALERKKVSKKRDEKRKKRAGKRLRDSNTHEEERIRLY